MNTVLIDQYIKILINLVAFYKQEREEFNLVVNTINSSLDNLSNYNHDGLTEDQVLFVYNMDHLIQQCVLAISNAFGAIEQDPDSQMYEVAQDTVEELITEFRDVLIENDTQPSEDVLKEFLDATAKKE